MGRGTGPLGGGITLQFPKTFVYYFSNWLGGQTTSAPPLTRWPAYGSELGLDVDLGLLEALGSTLVQTEDCTNRATRATLIKSVFDYTDSDSW